MTDQKSPARKSAERNPMSGTIPGIQSAALDPTRWLGTAWLEGMGQIGAELADFLAARIGEDVKTQHEILHCKDPAELQTIQARFMARAVEQYSAETGKLVEMSQDMITRMQTGKNTS
mgnify:CR=1 FL=1